MVEPSQPVYGLNIVVLILYKLTVMYAQMQPVYDLCIVGAGMVGSSIARHATLVPNYTVCLIGPQEPKNRCSITPQDILAAHYDCGRITTDMSGNAVIAAISKRSIERYRDIEEQSGVKFYYPVGWFAVGGRYIQRSTSNNNGPKVTEKNTDISSDSKDINTSLCHYVDFPEGEKSIYSRKGGWIDPRKIISAQLIIASNQGCSIIRDVVKKVRRVTNLSLGRLMEVQTEKGTVVLAKKVVLATNVFINHRDLLPDDVKPIFKASPQTVVYGEVSRQDTQRLQDMPCISYSGKGCSSWDSQYPRDTSGNIGFYMMPPILYPDGKFYMKIGHHDNILKRYLNKNDISTWHGSCGDPWLVAHLTNLLKSLVKDVVFKSFSSDSCVTMVTETHMPYIDMVHEQLGVAIGGNGNAAKSCDEIGRIATNMMIDKSRDTDIPMESFRLVCDPHMSSKL